MQELHKNKQLDGYRLKNDISGRDPDVFQAETCCLTREVIMFEKIYRLFEEELSGVNAKKTATDIFRFDRQCSFSQYGESARYCCELLKSIGLEGVKIWEFPADGKTVYGDIKMPKAWDAEEAELRIIEPASAAGVLASYRDEPLSLAMGSSSTPESGVETELVYIEDASQGTSYENVDVEGKIVFTSAGAGAAKLAHEKGAIGLVSDRMPTFDVARETPMDLADGRVWSKIAHDSGCFAFIISPRQGINLRSLLKQSETVKVSAFVKAKNYDGVVRIVDALLPGENREEEFLIIAHLFEPGANDNASGSALSIEIARTIQTLIQRSKLSQPRRSIRILLSHEFVSTMAYAFTQKDVMQRTIGGINPDMVGENQPLCKSALMYHGVPDACLSYLMYFARRLFSYNYENTTKPKLGRRPRFFWCLPAIYSGNDCFISDPSIGVPTLQITQWPDRFYHTSLDTPDKMSDYSMKRAGVLVGTFAYFMANAGPKEAIWLADQVYVEAESNMAETAQRMLAKARNDIVDDGLDSQLRAGKLAESVVKIGKKLDYLTQRDGSAIGSIGNLAGDDAAVIDYAAQVRDRLSDAANRYKQYVEQSIEASASHYGVKKPAIPESEEPRPGEAEAAKIILKRKVMGPLRFSTLPEEGKKRHSKASKGIPRGFVFWIDGKRNLLEIAKLVEQENDQTIDVEQMIKYCRFLEEYGYIEVIEP